MSYPSPAAATDRCIRQRMSSSISYRLGRRRLTNLRLPAGQQFLSGAQVHRHYLGVDLPDCDVLLPALEIPLDVLELLYPTLKIGAGLVDLALLTS